MKKIIIAVLIAAVISGLFIITRKSKEEPHEKKLILRENQMEPYLNLKGWKVTIINSDTVRIPMKFTGSYTILADEMKNSGLDLASHKGETVRRYTYSVDNCGEPDIIAELLITDSGELISAAIIQQKTNGFIKGIS